MSARRALVETVGKALGEIVEALGGAVERRYGRKDMSR
jgi:hypothetical protein